MPFFASAQASLNAQLKKAVSVFPSGHAERWRINTKPQRFIINLICGLFADTFKRNIGGTP
jgi:hypothetical protein